MTERIVGCVRMPRAWNWDHHGAEQRATDFTALVTWVEQFVATYHLARKVPACWLRHPGLVEELTALRYYHQEVYEPLVDMVENDDSPGHRWPDDVGVNAREYNDWQEARWRWMIGPLKDADGYSECRNTAHHDDEHAVDAAEHATLARRELKTLIAEEACASAEKSREAEKEDQQPSLPYRAGGNGHAEV